MRQFKLYMSAVALLVIGTPFYVAGAARHCRFCQKPVVCHFSGGTVMTSKFSKKSLKIWGIFFVLYICLIATLYFADMLNADSTAGVTIFMFSSMLVLMAYISPPYGLNLFYMKAVAPKEITLSDIYRSIVPFLSLQAIALVLLLVFPMIALWLPSLLFDYFQMIMHPDLLFSELNVLLTYPSLFEVLIDNPAMLFDAGNMANILSNTKVVDLLYANQAFSDFLLNSPEFPKLLLADDWLTQLPEMTEFLTKHPQFLDAQPQIKALFP